MTQHARPSSDVAVNSWTPTPLYDQLNETTYSDADYIDHNAVSYCEVALSSLDDPASSADHVLNYRLGRDPTNRSITIVVRLYQGSSQIAYWTHQNPAASFAAFQQTLSGPQADAITNYADLRLRFDITAIQNSQAHAQVSWAEFTVPDAPATDDLTAEHITAGTPTLDEPTIGQIHGLTATEIATAAPTLDEPTIGQEHALSATEIATAAPTLDEPILAESTDDQLTADDITTGTPTLDSPAIGQEHDLDASEIAVAAPTLGLPSLGQEHALQASQIATQAPTFDQPILVALNILTADDITAGTPTLDQPTLARIPHLTAEDITAAPSLDEPTIGQEHALAATDIATPAPTLDEPTIGQTHALAAAEIDTAAPTLDAPAIGQEHALTAEDVTAGTPTLDSPIIDLLIALDLAFAAWLITNPIPDAFTCTPASRRTDTDALLDPAATLPDDPSVPTADAPAAAAAESRTSQPT